MKIFPTRYLISGSIILILFFGCAEKKILLSGEKNTVPVPVLINPFPEAEDYWIFKTSIDFHDHYLSGLLVVKPGVEGIYRLVFMNELGMKFFDLEISSREFTVYHCYDALDRRKLLKIMKEAFTLLFGMEFMQNGRDLILNSDKDYTILRENDQRNIYYFVNNKTGGVDRIEKYHGSGKKISVRLNYYKRTADRICITFHKKPVS